MPFSCSARSVIIISPLAMSDLEIFSRSSSYYVSVLQLQIRKGLAAVEDIVFDSQLWTLLAGASA